MVQSSLRYFTRPLVGYTVKLCETDSFLLPISLNRFTPMKYGIKNGNAGMDTAKPGTLNVSVKKADKMITTNATKLIRKYTALEFLPNQPAFLMAKTIKSVARYVKATSVTDINPKSCLTG